MADSLRWQPDAGTLRLAGRLEHDTLLVLWQQRQSLMEQINRVDVSALERVDSAGLALLVHLHEINRVQGRKLYFDGVSDKLSSLIALYNLQQIIISDEKIN